MSERDWMGRPGMRVFHADEWERFVNSLNARQEADIEKAVEAERENCSRMDGLIWWVYKEPAIHPIAAFYTLDLAEKWAKDNCKDYLIKNIEDGTIYSS